MTKSDAKININTKIGIKANESEIEKRLFDSDLTIKKIQADNHFFINGFTQTGQNVFLISSDYKKEFKNILKTFNYSYFPWI